MVIFHGTGRRLGTEKLCYHSSVLVEYNATAYMNNSLFEKYITNYLIPTLGGHPTLFTLDLMRSHKTPTVFQLLRTNNITPSLIPTGCTSLVQPLDVLVNKPFKELMRDLTDEKIFKLESVEDFEKWTVGDCGVMTTHCVGEAFNQFHSLKAHVIKTSFHKLGLSLPIDGSLDHELDIKGFTNLGIGNWREDLVSLDDRADVPEEGDDNVAFIETED
ncbi:hypothetical protein L873DRAFT_1940149 [Choiromyces venosus 120613-1]|uniref:DDE-1 domain-containing protein n=1 Tax=Choiromyces venosus 120613-1 TaxID=1336337 RepID=A0A3N4JJW8_9PEZI|nr:hypothetical protein L873DRAFT_1940149 [Choiromyces venosus 120613-1]